MNAFRWLCVILLTLTGFTAALPSLKIDQQALAALDESIAMAAGTYATARIANGVVSVVQESEISLQPGGLGVSLAAGQILDPLNDATERVADLSILALGLLGTLRLLTALLAVPLDAVLPLMGGLALLLVLATRRWAGSAMPASFVVRAFLWLVLVRLTVPLMLALTLWLDHVHFEPKVEEALATLAFVRDVEQVPAEPPKAQDQGWLDWLGNAREATEKRLASMARAMQQLQQNFDAAMDALTDLFTAFIGKLAIQVFLMPLLVLWSWRAMARHWMAGSAGLAVWLEGVLRR